MFFFRIVFFLDFERLDVGVYFGGFVRVFLVLKVVDYRGGRFLRAGWSVLFVGRL